MNRDQIIAAGVAARQAAEAFRQVAATLDAVGGAMLAQVEADDLARFTGETPPDELGPDPIPSEATCGCTLFARCEGHEAARARGCTCNGPFSSSDCASPVHRSNALAHPARDPSRFN